MTIYRISSALTHPGRKRSSNQDFVTFFEPDTLEDIKASGSLYIVADGVGGAAKGDRASQYAAQKVLHEYYRSPQVDLGERLRVAMRQAGNEIYSFAERKGEFRMATTMVAAVIQENRLTVANVGDSRAYLYQDGVVKQITRDHSLVGEMMRDGIMTAEEARRSKIKNRITRSLGGETNVDVDVYRDIPIKSGDKILLCSDGFSQYATPKEITQLISRGHADEITGRMIDFALRRGGSDNISAILIDLLPEPRSADEEQTSRGQQPVPVDWDTLDTIPAIDVQYQRPAMWMPPFENWQVLAAAGAIIILLIFLVLWLG
jgi:PPM family protein phosphatase